MGLTSEWQRLLALSDKKLIEAYEKAAQRRMDAGDPYMSIKGNLESNVRAFKRMAKRKKYPRQQLVYFIVMARMLARNHERRRRKLRDEEGLFGSRTTLSEQNLADEDGLIAPQSTPSEQNL